ncbi:mitochondrial ribosomal death-associated protein 3-domain-containing protein [Scenedesmus sp. NREL 46B-D3]|nr:mitochondrial ribosomal death-associated protein 3-domain-containing protein [Scenedesmus sp. NREL 46B-D3]
MRCSQLMGCSISLTNPWQCRKLTTSGSSSSTAAAGPVAAPASAAAVATLGNGQSSSLQAPADGQGLLSTLITRHSSKELGAEHIGLYYDFNKALVPEAFRPFHQAFYSPRPAKLQRKGGCRSLQAEFDSTGSSSLMWRRSSQELAAALGSSSSSGGETQAIHLRGPAGAGKSIAVVQLVEWARNNGWLTLYIPSAVELTRGGFFYPRGDGTYDTLISAQHILKSFADSHEQQAAGLELRLAESAELLQSPAASAAAGAAATQGRGSLRDLVKMGLSTDDNGRLAVDCCLLLVKELAAVSAEVPVLLAVDGYNSLHWRSDYGRTISRTPRGRPVYQYRQELPVRKLNLARGFRLLERSDLQQCRVLAADSASSAVPADVAVRSGAASVYHMPRFSPVETAHALFYYHERGLVPAPPSQQQVAAMRALTNGSAEELRRWSVMITQTDMGLL